MTVLLMAATAMVLALVFFWLSGRSRKSTGIPAGEVFYQDLVGQPFAARNLRSLKLGISGKPDYLIQTADGMVMSPYMVRNCFPISIPISSVIAILCPCDCNRPVRGRSTSALVRQRFGTGTLS